MRKNKASASWNGNLKEGKGSMFVESSGNEFPISFSTRFEDKKGSNPEELIAAAHAGCFSMAFSNVLSEEGYEPESVKTTAEVKLEKTDSGFGITESFLKTTAHVPGIDKDLFMELAEKAKINCPVSKALSSLKISLEAELKS